MSRPPPQPVTRSLARFDTSTRADNFENNLAEKRRKPATLGQIEKDLDLAVALTWELPYSFRPVIAGKTTR
jgi:hypothetical protein